MPRLIELEAPRTYKTRENAIKAVEAKLGHSGYDNYRYIIHTDKDGRFFPVFLGMECMQAGIHFHFNIVA